MLLAFLKYLPSLAELSCTDSLNVKSENVKGVRVKGLSAKGVPMLLLRK